MTKSEVAKLVAVIYAAYPATAAKAAPEIAARPATATTEAIPASPGTSSAYQRMLADLDYPVANAAVEQLLATCKYMPTVAEIRERALSLMAGEARTGGEAWGSVLKAIRGAGRYRIPGVDFAFRDPVTAECVAAMSWVELCDSENQTADRARFIDLYDQLATRHRRAQLSESLPGMQQLRALQAAQEAAPLARVSAGDGEARSFGQVLKLVTGGDA